VPFRFPFPRSISLSPSCVRDAFCPTRSRWLRRLAKITLILITAALCAPALWAQDGGASDPTIAPPPGQSNPPESFNTASRFRYYAQTTFSPFAAVGPVLGASATEWITGNPPEWGQGIPGFGRRLLSGYTRQAISNTIILGVSMADREDPRHYHTGQHGFLKRGLFAAREAVISRDVDGGLMPAYSRIAGDYAAGFISDTWYPAREANFHSALYRGSTALASDIIYQEFKEFWPDFRRKFRSRH
jgi:hypothetical protein